MPLSKGARGKRTAELRLSSVPPFRIERVREWDAVPPLGTATISRLGNFDQQLLENPPLTTESFQSSEPLRDCLPHPIGEQIYLIQRRVDVRRDPQSLKLVGHHRRRDNPVLIQ